MKKLIFSFLAGVAGLAGADPASVHGMLIFGQQNTYVSHLPMYHSPHDYQLIMEVSLGKDEAKFKADQLAHPEETVYTIEPERFVLPTMVAGKTSFRAKVYRGHFERGGTQIFVATVQPVSMVFFKKLNATEPTPPALSLLLFGTAQEAYVAHHLTSRPNFDQVAKVNGLSVGGAALVKRNAGGLTLSVKGETDKSPLKEGQTFEGGPTPLKVEKVLYTEHGDLE